MTLEITNEVFRKYQMRTTEKESRIRARHPHKEREREREEQAKKNLGQVRYWRKMLWKLKRKIENDKIKKRK